MAAEIVALRAKLLENTLANEKADEKLAMQKQQKHEFIVNHRKQVKKLKHLIDTKDAIIAIRKLQIAAQQTSPAVHHRHNNNLTQGQNLHFVGMSARAAVTAEEDAPEPAGASSGAP